MAKEIERRFFVKDLPEDLGIYKKREITQGYIFFKPVIRLRKSNEDYYLTVKTKGALIKDEFEVAISKKDFDNMWQKVEGHVIEKIRYDIPLENGLISELDIFKEPFKPLVIVEVEFDSLDSAQSFIPPSWFGEEITYKGKFSNKHLAEYGPESMEL